jgi:hypothetical protein
MQDGYRFLLLADTALLPTSNVLEKESISALREWYEALGKTLWTIGPPNPSEDQIRASNKQAPSSKADDEKVLSFLDRVHRSHGAHSIVFVRSLPYLLLSFS